LRKLNGGPELLTREGRITDGEAYNRPNLRHIQTVTPHLMTRKILKRKEKKDVALAHAQDPIKHIMAQSVLLRSGEVKWLYSKEAPRVKFWH